MRKVILCGIFCLSIFSCQQEKTNKPVIQLKTIINEIQYNKSYCDIENDLKKIINDTCRYLIYVTDLSCSTCNHDYLIMSKNFSKNSCNYDSMFVIAYGEQDNLKLEYYLQKNNVSHPLREKIIIDDDKNTLSNKFFDMCNNNNIILIEKQKVLYSCSIRTFEYNDSLGMIMYLQ